MFSPDQIAFYHEHGYLRLPAVFDAAETRQLQDDMDWMIEYWANKSLGWTGPWRRAYMDADTEAQSMLIAMHELHDYAESWQRCVSRPELCAAISQLLDDGPVELHHSTMHVKPPETGHPFPMHQDWAFYKHADHRFVDAIVHLDDTCHDNGELRFLDASHKLGPLEHVTDWQGEPCTPHLPTDDYSLDDTVAVPARAGDVVLFNIHTIHGSYINSTEHMRRLVRIGYRHPDNEQLSGQQMGASRPMVFGRRPRAAKRAPVAYANAAD